MTKRKLEVLPRQHYDDTTGEWLTWKPLQTRFNGIGHADLSDAEMPVIGAFGTCGDLSNPDYSSWRDEHLVPVLEDLNINPVDSVFRPEVQEWSPLRAPIEGVNFARNGVLLVGVTNDTGSHASLMEAGFAAYGGLLRNQDVVISIEENEKTPESTRQARMLAKTILEATVESYPLFTLTDNLGNASMHAAIKHTEREQRRKINLRRSVIDSQSAMRQDLTPGIYLSGTSGSDKEPEWIAQINNFVDGLNTDVQIDDSYDKDWHEGKIVEELVPKLGAAVNLMAITKDTDSYGALAELGPRLLYGQLAGQSLGVYIEDREGEPNSPANRTRILAREHLSKLREDFPDLPIFVARNLEELALFGVSEYLRHRQAN